MPYYGYYVFINIQISQIRTYNGTSNPQILRTILELEDRHPHLSNTGGNKHFLKLTTLGFEPKTLGHWSSHLKISVSSHLTNYRVGYNSLAITYIVPKNSVHSG